MNLTLKGFRTVGIRDPGVREVQTFRSLHIFDDMWVQRTSRKFLQISQILKLQVFTPRSPQTVEKNTIEQMKISARYYKLSWTGLDAVFSHSTNDRDTAYF
jgi:hypothetical protein